ncbi:TrbC/VirB2 family protein [Brachymonas sp. M4Q-1]|uniref:TrbC/VirB2 family protein n=1 Tax=Brachymonas sp. M4Q-1 TaxID=3416906 RepID=UPI003CEBD908
MTSLASSVRTPQLDAAVLASISPAAMEKKVRQVERVLMRWLPWVVMALICALFLYAPDAMAQATTSDSSTDAGSKIQGFLLTVKKALGPISILIVTIAFIFAGYQIAFNHKRIGDVAPVLIGAIVIGAATQLAGWFINTSDFNQ